MLLLLLFFVCQLLLLFVVVVVYTRYLMPTTERSLVRPASGGFEDGVILFLDPLLVVVRGALGVVARGGSLEGIVGVDGRFGGGSHRCSPNAADVASFEGEGFQGVGVVTFDEDLVQGPVLWLGIAFVLFDAILQGPAGDFAEAGDHGPGAVAALVAVDEHRVVGRVEDQVQHLVDGSVRAVDLGVLVGLDGDLVVGDAVGRDEVGIVERDGRRNQGDDGLQLEIRQGVEVGVQRVAGSE